MTESRPTLYLIDGYALIYRAFFAMIARPLTTRRGENTSAAWGVTNFLIRLLETRRPDYLALVGDSSDNIPGVKGVGEKTALELLKTLGDLDAILASADRIPGKRAREAVQQHAELARWSRVLVTIRRDVPLPLDLEALRLRPPDVPRLTELFTELEFRSLIPKLGSLGAVGARGPAPAGQRSAAVAAPLAPTALIVKPTIVDDPAALAAMVAACRGAALLALDTETSSLDPMRGDLVGMSLAAAPGRSWYLPFAHVAPDGDLAGGTPPRNLPALASDALAPLRALLADAGVPKAGHNIKFAWLVLRRAGVELAGVAYDSMLASFVLDPGRRSHAIDDLARERLSVAMRTYAEVVGRGKAERPFADVPLGEADRKSTRLNSSHLVISYAVFCLTKKLIGRQHRAHDQ